MSWSIKQDSIVLPHADGLFLVHYSAINEFAYLSQGIETEIFLPLFHGIERHTFTSLTDPFALDKFIFDSLLTGR